VRNALFILGQLTDTDVEWLIAKGTPRRLEASETLIQMGRHADAMSIVLDGTLAVEIDGRPIAQRRAGEILGEMSFVDGNPPSATVRATTPSLVLSVPRHTVAEHLENDSAFAARFYRAVAMVLSARLRQSLSESGLTAATETGFPELGAEIDDAVLANVHVAGARCAYILRHFRAVP